MAPMVTARKTGASSKKREVISLDDSDESDEVQAVPNVLDDRKPTSSRPSMTAPTGSKRKKVIESDDEEDFKPVVKKASKPSTTAKKAPAAKPAATKKKPAPPVDLDGEDDEDEYQEEEEEEEVKPKARKAPVATAARKSTATSGSTAKKAEVKEEKKPAADKPKCDYAAAAARKAAGPAAPGSKEIPDGEPNCLAGLTIVFTGELESLSREEAQDLAKRFGARVTGAPSKVTSYVVLGTGAGPKKLETIEKHKIKTLTKDGFLQLIASRSGGEMDEKTKAKQEKEKEAMRKAALDMEKKEREQEAQEKRKVKVLGKTGTAVKAAPPASSQLWTTKYAPSNLKEICGNKANVERLGTWLESWPKMYKDGFKKPGKDGMGIYRAILISGPPGIGKTTAAHLVAKLQGYDVVEMNASDTRSKKLIQNGINIDNASLDGWFSGAGVKSTPADGLRITQRTCLIMDEVDGMSSGDRGGVGALNQLIRQTRVCVIDVRWEVLNLTASLPIQIPIVLIANDASTQKMKPLQTTCFPLKFKREKLKVDGNALDNLVASTQADIRQILNLLSTWKLSREDMSFNEAKELGKDSQKFTVQTPFSILPQLLGPYAFSATNRSTLNDRMDLYYQDFSFVPLFMQENYIRQVPARAPGADPEAKLKALDLMSKAADSISDGDLLDRLIHRYLGQNSKRTKMARQLGDVQIKMRLKVTGSRDEIRQDYMPLLSSKVVLPLTSKKGSADELVDQIMPYLDEYYLNKEDWDVLVDLGVGDMDGEAMLKKIPTQTKSTFTRIYNKTDHPVAFHKADMFSTSKKMVADKGPAPDIEDVVEDDVDIPDEEPVVNDDEANDLKNDKLIKVGGAKKGKAKAAAKPKAAAAKPKAPAKKAKS
ncbi:hypothetical protein QFC20_002439 [Naganishia adeliensis]|uniref:Uncharacterized protein n=1 Tax=Naganishia adeliensis TaxID=92952 RepID=A0ACC2WL99_9TREE|nr:hypothetical protein QFC20_002439 [Naganishia adeliensis]